jgi:hypothetical protein
VSPAMTPPRTDAVAVRGARRDVSVPPVMRDDGRRQTGDG